MSTVFATGSGCDRSPAAQSGEAPQQSTRIFVRVASGGPGVGCVEPVTLGVPMPRGACAHDDRLQLTSRTGVVPLQTRILARWPDHTIRWALLDLQHSWMHPGEYELTWHAPKHAVEPVIQVSTDGAAISIATGAARFIVARGGAFPFESAIAGPVDACATMTVVDAGGGTHRLSVQEVEVEERGPLRTVVRVATRVPQPNRGTLNISARLNFFANLDTVRVDVTTGNPDRAQHRGGYWELGDPRSVLLRDVALTVAHRAASGDTSASCSPQGDLPWRSTTDRLELYQASSGGEAWTGSNHVNRDGRNRNRFRGYELTCAGVVDRGARAMPVAVSRAGQAAIFVTVPEFWQNAPKALECDGQGVTLRLWPRQHDDLHEIQGGEQKTHTFYVSLAPASRDVRSLEWCRTPSVAHLAPEWYCAADVRAYLAPATSDRSDAYRALVAAAIDGPDSFESKRERIDEYGWRHYGELYADHEAAFHEGEQPLVSHYNNQYDALAGVIHQFVRSGDLRWWRLADPLARHVGDIDVYHTTRDKAAYNGGLFWHTIHYADADRSTHRSYPRTAKTNGGGPSSEHNYATGLALHYYLTGDPGSRDAALSLARWVIAMDDGRRSPFRWVSRGPTGLASATNGVHGPGRGAGNSICALLDGHALTGDATFLEKAEELIRRCIHPSDRITDDDLLDRERRWSYVVFLQALGRYLEVKRTIAQLDMMYEYARRSLLAYARWMADREFPYLDKPEQLEFPNETWPAQDIRKAEVFQLAAAYASGTERERFLERARFFFDYSTATLHASPFHARTRPTVLMLVHGYGDALFRANPPQYPAGPADASFPDREPFVPQKTIARRRLIAVSAVAAAAVIAAAAILLL